VTGNGYQLDEIDDRTWRVSTLFGGRDLFQYVLSGEDGATLVIDAGIASTPRDAIVPGLRRLGIGAGQVVGVVVTHPDLDHQGGLAALKDALPRAAALCGFADLGLVAEPERLLTERYGVYEHGHRIGYDEAAKQDMRTLYGAPVWIDLPLSGGESLVLGSRELCFLHAPGHSAGHLIVHEPASGLLFTSDALHGKAIPAADGSAALPPTYEDVDAYLASVELVGSLDARSIHSGHWPVKNATKIAAWLEESRAFVATADLEIQERLATPATLRALCEHLDARLGPFGAGPVALMFATHGHLRRLLRRGVVSVVDLNELPPRVGLTGYKEEKTDE
jgi:glyoxylase-like metal-dependent hydrolase (beta-lactamase superfamily II)